MRARSAVAAVLAAAILAAPAFAVDAVDTPALEIDGGLLRSRVADGRDPGLLRPDFGALRAEVESYYASIDWTVRWIEHGVPTPQARALISRFARAAERGLRPEDYDGPRWSERLAALARRQLAGADRRAELDFDLAVTISALRYVSDLHRGRVDPRHLGFPLPPKLLDGPAVLRSVTAAVDVERSLEPLEPRFLAYRRLRDALPRYLALAEAPQPLLNARVHPGERSAETEVLAAELIRLGDLPPDSRWTAGTYDGALVEAVRHFQTRHGLDPDGVLGRATLAALDVPLAERVQQIVLTLERWRWLPADFAGNIILVNIPEFRLRALRVAGDEIVSDLSMRVVVGDSFNHKTPLLVASLSHLIFHPYWNVPQRIARQELLPDFRKDPGSFDAHGYEMVTSTGDAATVVPATAESFARLERGGLQLRQRPGSLNALGVVKFVFPNPYDVYLHDTPGRGAFRAPRRDLSHGCVRVEDALGLARWVLRNQPEGSAEGLSALLAGTAPRRVDVAGPVRVFLLYGTALAGRDGTLSFFTDLYGHDRALARALGLPAH